MPRLRAFLTELGERAMGLLRRQPRSSAELRSPEGASARQPRLSRAALLRLLGFSTLPPEAEARGLRLLWENLSPAQREQQEKYGYFDVIGERTGSRYRIRQGFQVGLLDNKGKTKAVFCFMPEGELPAGDVMLAQKLALELFELDTLKIANKFSIAQRW
jgi:hypothetical protein